MVVECWKDRGVVIGHHEARTVQPLRLVHQHVAALVVCIVSNHNTTWWRRRYMYVRVAAEGCENGQIEGSTNFFHVTNNPPPLFTRTHARTHAHTHTDRHTGYGGGLCVLCMKKLYQLSSL